MNIDIDSRSKTLKVYPPFKNQPKILKANGTFFQEIIEFVWKRLPLNGCFAKFIWSKRLKDNNIKEKEICLQD